jgi:DNA-binding SARP family transcriptional activator
MNKALITESAGSSNQDSIRRWFEQGIGIPPCSPVLSRFEASATNDRVALDKVVQELGTERAGVTIIVAIKRIQVEGRNFAQLPRWIAAADHVLALTHGLSPLARACLGVHRVIAALLSGESLTRQITMLPQVHQALHQVDSAPLTLRLAIPEIYLHLLHGDIHQATECLRDYAPLAPRLAPGSVEKSNIAACCAVLGSIHDQKLVEDTRLGSQLIHTEVQGLELIPTIASRVHWLLAAPKIKREGTFETSIREIRVLVAQAGNTFLHACFHYSLGLVNAQGGRPLDALDHARMAGKYAMLCQCPPAAAISALLEGQCLIDLGRHDEARGALDRWLPWCRENAYLWIHASGELERANSYTQRGLLAQARTALSLACSLLPSGAAFPAMHRPSKFTERLHQQLLPAPKTRNSDALATTPVRVWTLGEFTLEINGKVLFDREWHGNRTKALLKALIVLGGHKVSVEHLCDLLWPSAEGDHAQQCLKVTLSRLRHLGVVAKGENLPWIVCRHKHVSLIASLCNVDAIVFRNGMARPETCDAETLQKLLDLYRGDFLDNDDSPLWIVAHRELLRGMYIAGVSTLARQCIEQPVLKTTIEQHLEQAIRLVPRNPKCYELLIRLHLVQESPDTAQETARRVQSLLQEGQIDYSSSLARLAAELSTIPKGN